MKRLVVVSLATTSAINVSEALVSKTMPSFTKRRHTTSSSTIKMYLDGIDESLVSSSLLTSTASPIAIPSNLFTDTSSHIASDPKLEAEILTDVSHVALDLTTFLSPNTAWIRFCNVIGRVLILTSDYIQDHYVSPDEAFFQAAMLVASTQMFLRSAWPVVMAASSKTSLSVRDRRAFAQLFSEVDLSVLQFKTLLTSSTLEWVEMKESEQVDLDGEHIYWLHSGEISSSLQESTIKTMIECDSLEISHRIFGEVHFAKALEESRLSRKTKLSKSNKANTEDSIAVNETLTAGSNGAILMRMSTSKLLKLMNHDDQLYDSINGLILLCMQEKLTRTFHKANANKSDVYQPHWNVSNITMM